MWNRTEAFIVMSSSADLLVIQEEIVSHTGGRADKLEFEGVS